jgi:hypothetical protein
LPDFGHDVLVTPILTIVVDYQNDQLVDFQPYCIDFVVSQAKDYLQDTLVEEGRRGNESLEDVDDLAFDSPVVSQQLLKQRLDNLLIKEVFVHSSGKIVETLHHS